jgi:D-glycero-D-manno-heptose 1,7-bisphosphate phosphatase
MSVRLVVLDRDGVINHDSDAFIRTPAEWRPLHGSLQAIALLTRHGFTVTVATNQSGIGRGLLDRATLQAIHRKMRRATKRAGGTIDRIVYCPHRPDDGCDCRKPATGLLERLARHYEVSMRGVPAIGDARRDLEAAAALGARPILVLTGKGSSTRKALGRKGKAVETYDDLLAAARQLVAECRARRP